MATRTFILCVLPLLAACGNGGGDGPGRPDPASFPEIVLDTHLTDLSRITLVVPSGSLSGEEIKAHSFLRTDGSAVPLYAPVDMTLTQGSWSGTSNDYGLVFEINPRWLLRLGHVTAPRADITSRISMADPSSLLEDVTPPIFFRAGDLIGMTTGTVGVNAFDFGLYDLAVEQVSANTDRYRSEMFLTKLHGVCPYGYFAAPLRPDYEALFGTISGTPVPGAPCRALADQSAPGAVAGEWTLVSHAPDGTYQRQFGLGTFLDGATVRIAGIAGTFDTAGGTDPKTVTTEVCYASGGNYVFLRMTSPTTLDAMFGAGPCPASFPAAGFRSYER